MGKYSTNKITITLTKTLLKKLNKVKDYPRWKGNRSYLIETILNEYFEDI